MPASLCMGQGIIIQLRTSATLSLPLTCLSFPPCPCPGNSRHKVSNLDALHVSGFAKYRPFSAEERAGPRSCGLVGVTFVWGLIGLPVSPCDT